MKIINARSKKIILLFSEIKDKLSLFASKRNNDKNILKLNSSKILARKVKIKKFIRNFFPASLNNLKIKLNL